MVSLCCNSKHMPSDYRDILKQYTTCAMVYSGRMVIVSFWNTVIKNVLERVIILPPLSPLPTPEPISCQIQFNSDGGMNI